VVFVSDHSARDADDRETFGIQPSASGVKSHKLLFAERIIHSVKARRFGGEVCEIDTIFTRDS
jgi:hypothetical protein